MFEHEGLIAGLVEIVVGQRGVLNFRRKALQSFHVQCTVIRVKEKKKKNIRNTRATA